MHLLGSLNFLHPIRLPAVLFGKALQLSGRARAEIGAGVLLDHATGVVVGETASIGDGCTLLHGVTLGTTGDLENTFDRHPKIGTNVLIGANASVLGNIRVGDNAKIGAGSVVLQPVPGGATVVGVPAKQVAE